MLNSFNTWSLNFLAIRYRLIQSVVKGINIFKQWGMEMLQNYGRLWKPNNYLISVKKDALQHFINIVCIVWIVFLRYMYTKAILVTEIIADFLWILTCHVMNTVKCNKLQCKISWSSKTYRSTKEILTSCFHLVMNN